MDKTFTFFEFEIGKSSTTIGYINPDVLVVTRNQLKDDQAQASQAFPTRVVGPNTIRLIKHYAEAYDKTFAFTNFFKEYIPPNKNIGIRDYRFQIPNFMQELAALRPKRILLTDRKLMKELVPYFKSIVDDRGTFFFFEYTSNGQREKIHIVPTYEFKNAGLYRFHQRFIERDIERAFSLPDNPDSAEYVDLKTLDHFRVKPNDTIFIDFETTGLSVFDKINLAGIMSETDGKTVYIVKNPTPEQFITLGHQLGEMDATLVAHNAPFEIGLMFNYTKGQLPWFRTKDTQIQAHCQGQPRGYQNLEHLTTFLTNLNGSKAFGSWEDPEYLAQDVYATKTLYELLNPQTRDMYQATLLQELTYYTGKNRWLGVNIDQDQLEFGRQYIEEERDKNEAILLEGMDEGRNINFRSGQAASEFLIEKGIKLVERTKTGNFALGKEPVSRLIASHNPNSRERKILEAFKNYKSFYSQRNAYLENYIEGSKIDGAIHPDTNLSGTANGRVSMKDPSLQTLPRQSLLKTVFISRFKVEKRIFDGYVQAHPQLQKILDYVNNHPEDTMAENFVRGFFGLVDLDQAELRVAALLSDDKKMGEAMTSGDPHATNAQLAFPELLGGLTLKQIKIQYPAHRKAAKRIVFSQLYGAMPINTAKKEGIPLEHAEAVDRVINHQYPKLTRYLKSFDRLAQQHGEENKDLVITLPFGHRRDFSDKLFDVKNSWKKYNPGNAARPMKNGGIQGTAAGIMLHIWRFVAQRITHEKLQSIVSFNVHDSLALDVHPLELHHIIRFISEAFISLKDTPLAKYPLFQEVPFTGDLYLGARWSSVEETCINWFHEDVPKFPNTSLQKEEVAQ